MFEIPLRPIPYWLQAEVAEYFVPFPFIPKTILDIGANIGAFTQRAQQEWPKATVIACEPMPFNLVQLRQNVKPNTQIISAAIRSKTGIDNIYVGDNFVTGGFVDFGRQTKDQIVVECLAARKLPSCELVKIDTEGCEVEIITTLDLSKTNAVCLEHHSKDDALEIKDFLSGAFNLIKEEPGKDIGTFVFLHKKFATMAPEANS